MSVFEDLYYEIDLIERHYLSGKIEPEIFQNLLAAKTLKEKVAKDVLNVLIVSAKYSAGNKLYKKIVKKGIIGEDTIIAPKLPAQIEDEKVLCPIKKEQITRSKCLEYSGEKANFDACKECDIGLANKKLLIPGPPMYTA